MRRVPESGEPEELEFRSGVNLLVGPPNAGKSKWIRFIDFVLGDTDPPEQTLTAELAEKYRSASVRIRICQTPSSRSDSARGAPEANQSARPDEEDSPRASAGGSELPPQSQTEEFIDQSQDMVLVLERRWKEPGMKGKIFVDGEAMTAEDFGGHLLALLEIPVVHYPRGDPYAPRAWPVLSWRSLFRHVYREERFWADLADKQFESEQHAALMQFVGLAESLFSAEYGDLVKKRKEIQRLHDQKDSYMAMLHRVTSEIGRFSEFSVSVTNDSLASARERLLLERQSASDRRMAILRELADSASAGQAVAQARRRSLLEEHGTALAKARAERQSLKDEIARMSGRIQELVDYRQNVQRERERLERASAAGVALSELKVTHCPVCDQRVNRRRGTMHECYLCLQPYEQDDAAAEIGSRRIAFETDQLRVEEDELSEVLLRHTAGREQIERRLAELEASISNIETLLRPTQVAVAAVLPPDLTLIDQDFGRIEEQLRTLDSVAKALEQRDALNQDIDHIESEVAALEAQVSAQTKDVRFESAATALEDGFNSYFNALNQSGSERWPEGDVSVRLRKRDFWIVVKNADWRAKLGATLACFFLNAYHYALLSLSGKPGRNYPGLAIIDFPPTLADDRELTDEENYLIEPFISLLQRMLPTRAQLIVAGRAFVDLDGANRIPLTTVWR